MLVKICGITRAGDAEAAVASGAGALGFVFWPSSPRAIDPDRARAITARIPPFVTLVGVFVNQPAEFVNQVATAVGLGAVQLHGDETPEFAQALRRPIVKAVQVGADLREAERWPSHVMLLVDAHDPMRRGGTGQLADWGAAARLARARPVLLAGGLTPDNVADAVSRVRPFGIDVSSGVERSPGVKDPQRIKALFDRLRGKVETRA